MSRNRRAADGRPSRSPESPDFADPEPKWASLTDTGSMQPSAEALDWQRRADAWAQQAESENSQAIEPANRWSDVAATGRPTFPADGVGWRTETAEWRATGARWRQTTEWRSTTGSHGWRSTTEAWQTGGASAYPPRAETPMAQPAISSTAWQTSPDEPTGTTADDSRPAWQQFAGSSPAPWQQPEPTQRATTTPSWQQPEPTQRAATTPSWQQPDPAATAPTWQQPDTQPPLSTPRWQQPETPTPSWQQPDNGTPSRRQPEAQPPSWQQPAPRPPAESSPSWQQLVDPTQPPSRSTRNAPETPSWRRGAIEGTATWADLTDTRSGGVDTPTTSRSRSEAPPESPGWQIRRDDGRHLVREDDRAAWRRDATDPAESSTQIGRRRAPEGGSRASGGTGWAARSDADNWAGYTDTGGIQLYPDPAAPPEGPSWGGRRDTPTRHDEPTGRRALPATPHEEPTYRIPPATPYEETGRGRRRAEDTTGAPALPGRYDDAPRGRRHAGEPRADAAPTGYPAVEPRVDGPPTGRRAARYPGAEPDQGAPPRRAAAQSAAMPLGTRRPDETRGGRRRRDVEDAGTPLPPTSRRAGAEAMPLDRRVGEPPRGDQRRRPELPSADRRGNTDVPPKGRARYNQGRDDWREQTGSWEAEPDTSSWTRDPDTGQWSRAEDDPRVLAWRSEAARREDLERSGEQRALPAAPAPRDRDRDPDATGVLGAPITDDWRDDDDPPPRGRGPRGGGTPYGGGPSSAAPRSGTPYGSGPTSAPRSAMPYGGEPSIAPRSAKPYGGEPGSAPRSALPYGGEPGSAPRSALPYDGDPGSAPRSGTPYGSGPTSAPRSAKPYGGEPSSAPRSATPYGGRPGSAPRSGIPYGETAYGSAPTSAIPSSGPGYGASAPASGIPYGGAPDGPRGGYGSAAPTSAPRASGVAPTGAPRSGTPYGTGSAGRDVAEDSYRSGRRRAAGEEPGDWRADLDPAGDEPTVGLDVWRQDGEPRRSRQNRRLGLPEDSAPSWAERGESSTDQRQRLEPGDWQRREREERARGSATYRGAGGEDWRRDLADQSNLSEGESRRYGTSDFVPFRSSGSAAVPRSSNLSMTSTSLVSPVPREQREAMARPQRSGNGFPGLTGSYERRAVTGGYPTVRRSDALDPDDEEDEQEAGGPLAAVGYTVVWYGVPVVLFILYMLVLNTGSQTQALDTLAKAAPQFGISLVLSILVAVGLRFVSQSWKAISVGLAAAVVGGGLATVLSSAITGNSLS